MEKRQFKVVVAGQYVSLGDNGTRSLKRYEEEFVLPSQEAALSKVCRHLLTPRLQKTHPDFIRYRTHELKSITVHGRAPDHDVMNMGIDEMSVAQLSDFCILRQIMIDPYEHKEDLTKCREAISAQWKQMRADRKARDESQSADEQKKINTLKELNQLPVEDDDQRMIMSPTEQKAKQTSAPNAGVTPGPINSVGEGLTPGEENQEALPEFEEDII